MNSATEIFDFENANMYKFREINNVVWLSRDQIVALSLSFHPKNIKLRDALIDLKKRGKIIKIEDGLFPKLVLESANKYLEFNLDEQFNEYLKKNKALKSKDMAIEFMNAYSINNS